MKLFDPILRLLSFPQRIRDLENQLACLQGKHTQSDKRLDLHYVRIQKLESSPEWLVTPYPMGSNQTAIVTPRNILGRMAEQDQRVDGLSSGYSPMRDRISRLETCLSAEINNTGRALEAHGEAIRTLAEAKVRKPRKK